MRVRARASSLYILYSLFFILYNDVWAGLREAFDKASQRPPEGFERPLKPSGGLLSYPQGLSTGYPHEGGSMISQEEAQRIRDFYQRSLARKPTALRYVLPNFDADEAFANADYNARARMIRRFLR